MRKILLEAGPLLVFFGVNLKFGIMAATAAFMVVTAITVPLLWFTERKVPVMPLVTAAVVLLFGGLTLWLDNDMFIKLKPTIVSIVFTAVLVGGLMRGKTVLKIMMGGAFTLNESGWRQLTWRWIGFFLALALLNEAVWRTQSTDIWVSFKVFGIMPLTLLFALAQMPLILRSQPPDDGPEAAPETGPGMPG